MSGDAMGFAVRHSPFTGVTYTVHLCLADSANDMNRNELWMAMGNLALKSRCSRRAAGLAVQEIVNAGFLDVLVPPADEEGKPTGRPGRYLFLFPDDLNVVFENRRQGANTGSTPPIEGAQTVRTGANTGSTGVRRENAQSQREPKENPKRQQPENDRSRAARERAESEDRVARAARLKYATVGPLTEELSANPLEHIAEIRRMRHEPKKKTA